MEMLSPRDIANILCIYSLELMVGSERTRQTVYKKDRQTDMWQFEECDF